MTSTPAPHYTGVIEITKTTPAYEERNNYGQVTKSTPRESAEIVRLVVRSDTLSGLRDKLAEHIALVDE